MLTNLWKRKNFIDPRRLTSPSRADIWVRFEFLQLYELWRSKYPDEDSSIFIEGATNEIYPRFISDHRRTPAIPLEPMSAMKGFIWLYDKINKNRWKDIDPILVRKETTGFTLIDGAHRLAIALFLRLEEIPVKFVQSNDNPLDYSAFLSKHYNYPQERTLYIKYLI